MLGSGILLLLGFLAHVGLGSSNSISVSEFITEVLKGPQEGSVIVWQFRIPRAIQCVLTGAILGTTGSVFQSLFRNPLAEPYIVGTASGAAVGGALVTAFGLSTFAFGLAMPVAGFFSGLLSLWVVMRLATRRGTLETPTLLLAGVVAALEGCCTGVCDPEFSLLMRFLSDSWDAGIGVPEDPPEHRFELASSTAQHVSSSSTAGAPG